ncbi:MAG TPA: ROK family protein [Actinomycetota bacterium]|nr:ROK family protein [Actinomycetota bacterium]
MSVTIGIDVGGTKIAAGVVDEAGKVVARRQIATAATHPTAVVAGIVKVAQELMAAAPNVTAIGIGAAGLVDGEKGVVLSAPNIKWENVQLRAMVSDRLKLPVLLDNDANVAALGESVYGAGKGYGDQIMLTIGTGVGGGIVIGGEIYRGSRGVGAELGHTIVDASGSAVCSCGNHGCLEALASGNSIGRRARERVSEPGATAVLELAGKKAVDITGELVGEAAKSGDVWAREIIAETGRWLGVGIASFVNIFDPDVVIVAGGAAAGTGELLLGPARDEAAGLIIGHAWRKLPPVVPATLGYDAGLVGAAVLARGSG